MPIQAEVNVRFCSKSKKVDRNMKARLRIKTVKRLAVRRMVKGIFQIQLEQQMAWLIQLIHKYVPKRSRIK